MGKPKKGVEPIQLRKYREGKGIPATKQRILDFFRRYRGAFHTSPTYEEIAVGIGWDAGSKGSVHTLCMELVAEGWLTKLPKGVSRSLIPTEPPPAEHYISPSATPDV